MDFKKAFDEAGKKAKEAYDSSAKFVSEKGAVVSKQALQAKDEVIKKLDQDGNGEIDINDIIIMGIKTPGIKIDRNDFLRNELFKNYDKETIDKAIAETPAKAGIKAEEIDKIADHVINYERNIVSGISTALGVPGGVAMAATIPTDIAQYYGGMLRALQKLLYLYGFPQLDLDNNKQVIDSETMNTLTICLGVMFGVAGANEAFKAMAKALGTGVEKQLIKKALTKGAIYPIVKKVAKWFSVNMTKEIFAGFFKKAIPVVGGVIGGGITYLSFKPCCDKLKDCLKDTILSNPNRSLSEDEDIVDVEINDSEDKVQ